MVASTERPVLATEHEGTDGVLGSIFVDLQAVIVQVAKQLVLFVVQVVKRLAGRTHCRCLRQHLIEPGTHIIQDRSWFPVHALMAGVNNATQLRQTSFWALRHKRYSKRS
jgi:hypothetical protein